MNRVDLRLYGIGVGLFLLIAHRIDISAAEDQLALASLFAASTNITDSKLHVRITYNGQEPLEVYNLTDSRIRIVSPGKWVVYRPARQIVTGPGIITTQTLKKDQAIEYTFSLPELFTSVESGPNEFVVEITLITNDQKNIPIRQTVQANLSPEQIADGWRTTHENDLR